MKPVVLIYANCQGSSLSTFFSQHPNLKEVEVLHVPACEQAVPAEAEIARCNTFIYQKAFGVPSFMDRLPAVTRVISIPTVSCSFLWPFSFDRPTEPVGWRFPYGDRFLIGRVEEGLSADEAAQTYMDCKIPAMLNLPRLIRFEFSKWDALDRDNDVKIADFLKEHILTRRLFFTPDHPTDILMLPLANRLLNTMGFSGFLEPDWERHDHTRGGIEVPIHHSIIDALGIKFVPKDHLHPLWGNIQKVEEVEVYRRYASALQRPSYDEALIEAGESIIVGDLANASNICALIRLRKPDHSRALATMSLLHALTGQRGTAVDFLARAFTP